MCGESARLCCSVRCWCVAYATRPARACVCACAVPCSSSARTIHHCRSFRPSRRRMSKQPPPLHAAVRRHHTISRHITHWSPQRWGGASIETLRPTSLYHHWIGGGVGEGAARGAGSCAGVGRQQRLEWNERWRVRAAGAIPLTGPRQRQAGAGWWQSQLARCRHKACRLRPAVLGCVAQR